VTIETAPEVEFTPGSPADMQFIRSQLERERLDTERLEPEQFITIREGEHIVACGRIKPYQRTYELGSVWVAEDRRGRRLGERITRELVRRFPQDEVYLTTDAAVGLPAYYERLGFLRTKILPDELVAKIKRVCETLNRDAVGMVYDRRMERLPTIAETYRAKHVLEKYLPRTPLRHNLALSRELDCEAYLKLENLQPIGAFKVRGGVYLASTLSQ
jgi:N-acetylglutamate synthase-like GNAT family acetyltransferase